MSEEEPVQNYQQNQPSFQEVPVTIEEGEKFIEKDAFVADVKPVNEKYKGITSEGGQPLLQHSEDPVPSSNQSIFLFLKPTLNEFTGVSAIKKLYPVLYVLSIIITIFIGLVQIVQVFILNWVVGIFGLLVIPFITIVAVFLHIYLLRLAAEFCMSVFIIRGNSRLKNV